MAKRQVKQTIKKTPAWHAQAREEAGWQGVSEAKVKRQVETELIRLIAVEIARHEHQRMRAEKDAQPSTSNKPSTGVERRVRKTGSFFPGD